MTQLPIQLGVNQIEELVLEYSPTILFVEHDREFCINIATKVIEL
jgi:lincosamide and streptogramin A transport system ATP-binding/permease protein